MTLNIHQYSVKRIKWLDIVNGKIVTKKYYGEPISENDKEIVVKYRNKVVTLNKEENLIVVDYVTKTELAEER